MVISPLPQATIHLLGSCQTLTTSLSLVKELIDNALDAKATSVDVSISQNTLDKVEVRDNGHGISSEDLDALGRRGHTSKLRSFDELRSIGGASLGFRGEALASAAQLGQVSITTKTEGDAVASCVILKPTGGILKQTRTSHPVGTTVCVKDFISRIPVRQQTALKASARTLVKIRELLQSYALARPTTKFSLKVMKEKKDSWSFVPRPSEGIRGVVQQVIGRNIAIECVEQSFSFPESLASHTLLFDSVSGELGGHAKEGVFVVEMFLPKPDANAAHIGQGQYLSVDSRPIANDKGTMRKIVTLFKYYVRGSCGETADSIKNPFLRMNIVCPVASYDLNIEPGKDDILFGNEEWVIESIESFFKSYYGEQLKVPAAGSQKSSAIMSPGFRLLLARNTLELPEQISRETPESHKQSLILPNHLSFDIPLVTHQARDQTVGDEESASPDKEQVPSHRSKWAIDMSSDFSEEVEDCRPRDRTEVTSSLDGSLLDHNVNDLNPWAIDKLTAPRRPGANIGATLPRLYGNAQQVSPVPATPHWPSEPSTVYIKAPVESTPRQRRGFDHCQITPIASQNSYDCRIESHTPHGATPVRRRSSGSSQETELLLGDDSTVFAHRNDFISARHVTKERIADPNVPESIKISKKSKESLNKSFVPPFAGAENDVSRDILRQTTLHKAYQIPQFQQIAHEGDDHPDLAWSMDFEHRKAELTRQQRQKAKAARTTAAAEQTEVDTEANVARVSPHKNRYHAALATLSQEQPRTADIVETFPMRTLIPDGDPRAYLIRRQRSMSAKLGESSKATRMKSSRLPLERIPETEKLHKLMLNVPTNIDIIQRLALMIGEEDPYFRSGCMGTDPLVTVIDSPDVVRRIQSAAMKWKETHTDGKVQFDYNFGNLDQLLN